MEPPVLDPMDTNHQSLFYINIHSVLFQIPNFEYARTLRKTPLAVLKLLRTSTNIVTRSKAQNIIHGLILGNITPGLADNKRQLCLVVTGPVLGNLGHIDLGRVGPVHCGPWLDEEDRHVWDGHVGFLGVVTVVEAHAADYGDIFHLNRGKKLEIFRLVKSNKSKSGLRICCEDLPEQPAAAYRSLHHRR